jgi:uncharacterized membrane protein (UPF0136 family)
MTPSLILWIYIGLLVLGGLMGFLKAKSKPSLIASAVFAGALALVNTGVIHWPPAADVLLVLLLVVFGIRYGKTKKFIPAGMMIILTAATLVLLHVV